MSYINDFAWTIGVVLSTQRRYIPKLVKEAIEIAKYPNFNRGHGLKLSSPWNPVMKTLKYYRPSFKKLMKFRYSSGRMGNKVDRLVYS